MKVGCSIWLGLTVWLALPAASSAYTRSQSETSGRNLWWRNREVVMHLNGSCSADVAPAACTKAVVAGLQTWSRSNCSDFKFTYGGASERRDLGYDQAYPENNMNLIRWIEQDWELIHPVPGSQLIVALSTVSYNQKTGEIYDADISFNGEFFQFVVGPSGPSAEAGKRPQIIQNVMAHEVGHALGLGDLYGTQDAGAVMYGVSGGEEEPEVKALSPDDAKGLCAIYPMGQPTPEQLLPASDTWQVAPYEQPLPTPGCNHVPPGQGMLWMTLAGMLGIASRFRLR